MQSDPVLAYFAEEQQQKYQDYMMKISIEQFKQLDARRLKEQYKVKFELLSFLIVVIFSLQRKKKLINLVKLMA